MTPESGIILNFVDDIETGTYSIDSGKVTVGTGLKSFFSCHPGIDRRAFKTDYEPETSNISMTIFADSLNDRLREYYSSPTPRRKLLG